MPVASLPDLELVCAPRSSLSTQKYKPKVGGTKYITVPLPKFWGDASPLSPRDLRHCKQAGLEAYSRKVVSLGIRTQYSPSKSTPNLFCGKHNGKPRQIYIRITLQSI